MFRGDERIMPKSALFHTKRRGRRYRTLFLSIAVTFAIICAFLLTLSFYRLQKSTGLFLEEQNRVGSDHAAAAVQDVSSQLHEYLQLCDLLAADSAVRDLPDRIGTDPRTWVEYALDVRSKLLSAQAHFGDVALEAVIAWYPERQIAVSSKMIFSSESLDFFFNQYSLSPDFLNSLPGTRNALLRSESGTFWITRGVFRQGSIYAYLLLGFQPRSLLDAFSEDDVLEIRLAGNRLYRSDEDAATPLPEDLSLPASSLPQILSFGDAHYYPASETLRAIQTTVLGLMNAEGRLLEVRAYHRQGLIQILISAVIVILLALVFTYRIYLPIQRLLTNAMVVEESASLSHAMETVGDRLRSMSDENERYQMTLEASDYLLQGERLQYILTLPDEKAEKEYRQFLLDHHLRGKGFISETPILYMPSSGDRAVNPDTHFGESEQNGFYSLSYMLLSNTLNEKFNFLLIKVNSFYVLLTESGEPGDMTLVQRAISDYVQYLREYGVTDVLCSATMPVHSAAEMRKLLDEIPNTMENLRFYQGRTKDGSAGSSAHRPFPTPAQLQSLTRLMDSGKDMEAMELLKSLLSQLFSMSTDRRYCVRRVHGLMMIVMTSLEKRCGGIPGSRLSEFEERIASADTVDALKDAAWQIAEELMTPQKDLPEQPSGSSLLVDVLSYLDQHYMDHDLSMAVLASEFHVNESTLSRIFRQEKGTTFLEYLQSLRLQKAKELLKTCSVKETAAQVGFWDAQALIRVFKKYEGITPGQYKDSIQDT